jgi:two-component system, cell cycle sensor histidine kinase and response regulator CckA
MSPDPSQHRRSMIEAKLELAERVLAISNRLIQVTTEIFVRGGRNADPLVEQQLECFAKIRILVQRIEELLDSRKEKELFAAASVRWSSIHRYEQSLHSMSAANKMRQLEVTTADVVLPLLLDNFSWMAFIELLRADLDLRSDWEQKKDIAARAADLVRANQQLKSKIAERKRIEERLSQLASIIESSNDAIIIHTLAGTMVSWNAGAQRLYGYDAGEVLGKSGTILLPPDHRDELPCMLDRLKSGERVEMHDTVHVRKDGEFIDVSTAISPVHDAAGKMIGAAAITRDVSDRKKAEERFYKAFYANPEPITIARLEDGMYIDVNDSFLRVTGCRREDVIGRTSVDLNFWERADDRALMLKALEKNGSIRDAEITFLTKSGEQRIGLNSAEIIEIHGKKCVLSIFRDMTEQKALESQLRKSQRMDAIGQLSGGIAHDFNNLLTVMIGHSELLEERLARSEASLHSVTEIKKAGTHAASLTRQLLAFSRQQMLEQKVLDLNGVITDLEKMLQRLIGENIKFKTLLDPKLGRIKADPSQMQQIIMNLIVNARDAMPHGGNLLIRTANAEIEADLKGDANLAPGPYVLLEITDTGVGMDPATQARMFEPFFTTKEVGKGTGLGLSTVYGVVKQSSGHIAVKTAVGHGTTFSIYLPRTAEKPLLRKPGPCRANSLRGTETVLLVEDSGSVRELTREWLKSAGYDVLEANDPDDAIRIATQHHGVIHVLMTDVIMPGMNGPSLAKKLTAMRPDMKVLYISGYTGFIDQKLIEPAATIVSKPFTREVLLGKLRDAVSAECDHVPA